MNTPNMYTEQTQRDIIINENINNSDVVFLHDSLGRKINDTLLIKENVKTKKILTYTLKEI